MQLFYQQFHAVCLRTDMWTLNRNYCFSLHVGMTEIRVEMTEHFETFYCIRKQDCYE